MYRPDGRSRPDRLRRTAVMADRRPDGNNGELGGELARIGHRLTAPVSIFSRRRYVTKS